MYGCVQFKPHRSWEDSLLRLLRPLLNVFRFSFQFSPTIFIEPASLRSLHSRFIRYSVFGLLPGFVLGPALYYGRMRNQPEVAYFDRAYRLRRNKGQVHVDLLSLTGAVAGGCLSPWTPYRPVEAAVVGMFFGLTIAIIGPRILDK
ncbi:unnamed protein product [Dicrocoelium dendriticum]|nr:unnamed protein product [Dicrocoelium dendriticum]